MTIFSKIVAGEIPAYKVAESDDYSGFPRYQSACRRACAGDTQKRRLTICSTWMMSFIQGLQIFAKIVATGLKKSNSM